MSKKKILVVDDELDVLEMFEDLLPAELGAEVDKAEDGLDAFLLCQDTQYDLIISDYKMPIMSGAQLVRALVEKENLNSSTPLFLISGFMPELEAEELDEVILLEKPIDFDRLIKLGKMHIFGQGK